jgi:hypothetical protein
MLHRLVLHSVVDMRTDSAGGARLGETMFYADIVTIPTAACTQHIFPYNIVHIITTLIQSLTWTLFWLVLGLLSRARREGSPQA